MPKMSLSDPKVRKDGKCAQCRKERKHAVWNKYSHDAAIQDPFCSTQCCRKWYGMPEKDFAAERRRAAKGVQHGAYAADGGFHGTVRGYRVCACEACMAAVNR